MNASESFDIAARAFRNASGHLAPGKNGCTHSPECEHDWKIWCAAVEYMKGCRPEIEDSLIAAAPDLLEACKWFVKIEDAASSGKPLLSNQGQGMDGYSMLANFRGLVKDARAAVDKAEGKEAT